ncbi:IclR family transcriptional regulator [Streptomyces collinus]|uniref:DNA-binding IclR family transcriptional regulator n=1 Tax=Streptomyces collinus TaxID=42684 RepID=A0AA89QG04_STRCU|nr:IclR family transcriptional regulator [Streptomyces collinus]MBB5816141.1 DNA-binding IclR family transcriptional regulator [Streptomyces collinus]WMX68991.1 IclR family transcriptional regulator [Streptomyces collinus]
MQNPEPSYPVSAAGNALRVVRLLHEHDELRVLEVAARLGVARSTAHRILAMLVFEGFTEQDRHKVYRPGPALRAIRGSRAAPPPDLITLARPHLQRLADIVRETTHLTVLEGNATRFLDGVEGPQALRVTHRTGALLPAHVTSGGKALLAELPPERLRMLYPNGLPGGKSKAPEDVQRLVAELTTVRRAGWALNLQESERGVNAVGACVRDRTSRAVAAVAVAAPSARYPKGRLNRLASPLLPAARDIGHQL